MGGCTVRGIRRGNNGSLGTIPPLHYLRGRHHARLGVLESLSATTRLRRRILSYRPVCLVESHVMGCGLHDGTRVFC